MELRDIEIFLRLAEELHFGRTAEKLHITQARVSQSIAKQERRIGAALFERSSRKVALTPIGARLRDDLQAGYDRIQEGIDTAVESARGTEGALRLGLFGTQAHDLAPLTRAFRARHPGCELTFREVPFSDPFGQLRAGEIDVQTCWLPVREPDLTVGPVVLAEPLWLMVDEAHPLAGRESVCLEDLADCTLPGFPEAAPAYWVEAIEPTRTPSGRPIARGPVLSTFQEVEAAVVSGTTQCVVHSDAPRYYRRPGIVYIPIEDAPLGRWALLWRTAGETALVRAYAQVAAEQAADR
ncbi:LysR family transcriptional regulator [Streptomyces sp. A7024]|uniref:LysR family transcriptional regulator n=1 Tax=Streptomyces coryli TaxID=1128680 RepID=A0A6G4U7V1_9ACTN|nr:LysR family transcriptional regulator [Streptomyces coryli]NGN67377.1 LysR family transcriptional regulator [Streptomyces coryli]